ncbi:MAG: hypothetical protein RLZZ347_718 [Candidatus Parcubacteria bacterium]|jgi:hypothetical protein
MKKLSHPEFTFLLQLSIQGLVTFGTPRSLTMLTEILIELNAKRDYPRLPDDIARSAELYNRALMVEEVFGFTALQLVSNCPRCNQIFAMAGTRESETDHKVCRQYTLCPFCRHQFDSSCWPIHPLRNVPARLANVLVGQE